MHWCARLAHGSGLQAPAARCICWDAAVQVQVFEIMLTPLHYKLYTEDTAQKDAMHMIGQQECTSASILILSLAPPQPTQPLSFA